jgi:hypothetical protein
VVQNQRGHRHLGCVAQQHFGAQVGQASEAGHVLLLLLAQQELQHQCLGGGCSAAGQGAHSHGAAGAQTGVELPWGLTLEGDEDAGGLGAGGAFLAQEHQKWMHGDVETQ